MINGTKTAEQRTRQLEDMLSVSEFLPLKSHPLSLHSIRYLNRFVSFLRTRRSTCGNYCRRMTDCSTASSGPSSSWSPLKRKETRQSWKPEVFFVDLITRLISSGDPSTLKSRSIIPRIIIFLYVSFISSNPESVCLKYTAFVVFYSINRPLLTNY